MSADEPTELTPAASSPAARRVMQGNRADSRVERRLRSELHRRGLRFRKHAQVLPGVHCRPDIVFPRARVAVFVDGCFWHACPEHGTQAKANAAWWQRKLADNVERDRRNTEALRAAGWTVLRLWEHEEVPAMADLVVRAIRGSSTAGPPAQAEAAQSAAPATGHPVGQTSS